MGGAVHGEVAGHEMAAQSRWRVILRAGVPVWLYRHAGSFIAATLTALLAACFFYPLARIAWLRAVGRPDVISRDYNVATASFWFPILLFVIALTSFMALTFWRLVLLARVRFASSCLEYADWWGRRRSADYADIVAAGVFTHVARRGGHKHDVRICQLTPGSGQGSRWTTVCGSFVGVHLEIAEAVLYELSGRCQLSELSPASQTFGVDILQRPGHEVDIPCEV
ncbi:MAG: hypothetical protein MUQ26_01330 [Armatimonadetes bacterium]|nr:hypothetical protein [Armatimonadota bacterium]